MRNPLEENLCAQQMECHPFLPFRYDSLSVGFGDSINQMTLRELTAIAEDEVRKAQAELPDEIRECLSKVPVFLEGRPSSNDFLPLDTLGVFEEGAPIPRIRIWLGRDFFSVKI